MTVILKEDYPKPKPPAMCRCGKNPKDDPHQCPYAAEIANNDDPNYCECCPECTAECRADI